MFKGILAAIAVEIFQILTAPIYGIAPAVMYYALNQKKGVDAVPSKSAEQKAETVLLAENEMPDRVE